VSFVFFLVFFVFSTGYAAAQSSETAEPKVTATLTNITRVESWSFFQPLADPQSPDDIVNPKYTFAGDRAQLGVRVEGARFDIAAAFNYVRLENLPTNAIGPGALGSGAFYYAASGLPFSYQVYLSELNLVAKSRGRGFSTRIGRMRFASGAEFTSPDPRLETIKRERLHSRLAGEFEWSLYQRRFDGVRADWDHPHWHISSSLLLPTQGGYEESANLTISKLQLASASVTRKGSAAESQIFGHLYHDRRSVTARPDNTGFSALAADVTIAAVGASHAAVVDTSGGELDVVGWFAGEFGDWYGQSHLATSVAAEVGHRWTRAGMRPWVRGGYLFASGDGDQTDSRHTTFFQMLPSSRQYALSSVYTQMNLRDAFVQTFFEPGRGVKARIEAHRLDLASGQDRWYYGSGATAGTGGFFGFSGRSSNGETSLGTVVEGTVEVPIKRYWSINAYVGSMWGGRVVRGLFEDRRLGTWYIENVLAW
jgi:Alginate export